MQRALVELAKAAVAAMRREGLRRTIAKLPELLQQKR
jgi:hypothetical protein